MLVAFFYLVGYVAFLDMRALPYINLLLLVAIAFVGGLYFFYTPEKPLPRYVPPKIAPSLPNRLFAQSEEALEKIGEGLTWRAPQMQLPDLRKEILYYGQNARPDFDGTHFQVGLKSTQEMANMQAHEPVYLVYKSPNPSQRRGSYRFSEKNRPTPLWLELEREGEERVQVRVYLCDERGERVHTPSERQTFAVQAHKNQKGRTSSWHLEGKEKQYRVDSTLLVRQKALWFGCDRFLEMHGGEEFAHILGRERIDFLTQERPYSCYVGEGDFLVWKEGCWTEVGEEMTTAGLPLLVVKKIDQSLISFELWNPEGSGKTLLSLVRTRGGRESPDIKNAFKFVGAKTWAQFIVESSAGERFTLRPNDWLVMEEGSWRKLDSPDAIDAYVEGKISGPLFIFDKMDTQNGRQILLGHLFNQARTEVETVELTPVSTTSLANFYRNIPDAPPLKPETEDGIDE